VLSAWCLCVCWSRTRCSSGISSDLRRPPASAPRSSHVRRKETRRHRTNRPRLTEDVE
jgi:hypothetical protein